MSDFFDDLGDQLRMAVPRAADTRWTGRLGAPIRMVALTASVAVPLAIVVFVRTSPPVKQRLAPNARGHAGAPRQCRCFDSVAGLGRTGADPR